MKEYKCTKCNEVIEKEYIYKIYSEKKKSCKCKKCKAQDDKIYYLKNKDKIAKYHYNLWRSSEKRKKQNRRYKENNRFGMDATDYVKNKKCENCGLTNKEHYDRWNERLHIHHIGFDGRKNQRLNKNPNNAKNNYKVLCRQCHVSIEATEMWRQRKELKKAK